MNKLKSAWKWLSGRKTFWSSFLGFVYLFGTLQGWVQYDQTVVDTFASGVAIGVLHKIFRFVKETS